MTPVPEWPTIQQIVTTAIDQIDWLDVFNTVAIAIFVVELVAVALRLFWRFNLFRAAKRKVPVLLRRDILLLSALGIYFGVLLVARVFGVTAALREPIWFVPATVMVLGAMGYWTWVEYHELDGGLDDSGDRWPSSMGEPTGTEEEDPE